MYGQKQHPLLKGNKNYNHFALASDYSCNGWQHTSHPSSTQKQRPSKISKDPTSSTSRSLDGWSEKREKIWSKVFASLEFLPRERSSKYFLHREVGSGYLGQGGQGG